MPTTPKITAADRATLKGWAARHCASGITEAVIVRPRRGDDEGTPPRIGVSVREKPDGDAYIVEPQAGGWMVYCIPTETVLGAALDLRTALAIIRPDVPAAALAA